MMTSLAILAGAAFGALYIGLLWVAARLLTGGRSVWLFAALGLARAVLLAGVLWLAIATGATAVQIAFSLSGFIVVRLAATRLAHTNSPERP